jgi:hypothetical protein
VLTLLAFHRRLRPGRMVVARREGEPCSFNGTRRG